MSKSVLILSATSPEVQICAQSFIHHTQVHFLTGGVGMLSTAFALMNYLMNEPTPEYIIQAGIAGSYDRMLRLGDVCVVANEFLGSCGVEEHGCWRDMADLGFRDKNEVPFRENGLRNPYLSRFMTDPKLLHCNAVTVDEITTHPERAAMLQKKYDAVAESMEGAAMHYICLQRQIPFLQLRAFSNYVTVRDKAQWELQKSIGQLNRVLEDVVFGCINN